MSSVPPWVQGHGLLCSVAVPAPKTVTNTSDTCLLLGVRSSSGVRHRLKHQPVTACWQRRGCWQYSAPCPLHIPPTARWKSWNSSHITRRTEWFLGTKHQPSVNTSKFRETQYLPFQGTCSIWFYFSLLWVCNNSSKSNFRFFSSSEGSPKGMPFRHTPEQRRRLLSLKERPFWCLGGLVC